MPNSFTEGRAALEGLLSEGEGQISRDNIVVATGSGVLAPGTILGKVTATGKYKPSAATGTDGSEVAVAILGYPVDATTADVPVMAITRYAEWVTGNVSYDVTVSTPILKEAKKNQLAAVGIILR